MARRGDTPPTSHTRGGATRAPATQGTRGPQAPGRAAPDSANRLAPPRGAGARKGKAQQPFDPAWEAELARHREAEDAGVPAPPAPPKTGTDDGEPRPRPPAAKPAQATPQHMSRHLPTATAVACAVAGMAAATGLHMQGWPQHGSPWAWAALGMGAGAAALAHRALPRQGPWPARAMGLALLVAAPALLWGGARLSDTMDRRGFVQGVEARIAAGVADLDLRPPSHAPHTVADSLLIPVDEGGSGIACLRDGESVQAVAVRPGPVAGSSVSQPWALRDRAAARALCAQAFGKANSAGWFPDVLAQP